MKTTLFLFFGVAAALQSETWHELTERGEVELRAHRYEVAEGYFAEALRIAEQDGSAVTRIATSMNNLAGALRGQARLPEARQLFTAAVAKTRECPTAACSLNRAMVSQNLGVLLVQLNELFEAEQAFRESLRLHTARGDAPEIRAALLQHLAWIELYRRKPGSAEDYIHQGLALLDGRKGGQSDQVRFDLLTANAIARFRAGRRADTAGLMEEAQALADGSDIHPDSLLELLLLQTDGLAESGDLAAAGALLERADRLLTKASDVAMSRVQVGLMHAILAYRAERWEQAEQRLRQVIGDMLLHLPPDHPEAIIAKAGYASVLRKLGRKGEAKAVEKQIKMAQRTRRDDPGRQTVSFRDLRGFR